MIILKLSDEDAKSMDISSVADLKAKLDLSKESETQLEIAESKEKIKSDQITGLDALINTLSQRVTNLEASSKDSGFDQEAFKTDLLMKSAQATSEAISKAGGSSFTQDNEDDGSQSEAHANGDYEAEWKANKNIQAEFPTAGSYRCLMEARERFPNKQF